MRNVAVVEHSDEWVRRDVPAEEARAERRRRRRPGGRSLDLETRRQLAGVIGAAAGVMFTVLAYLFL